MKCKKCSMKFKPKKGLINYCSYKCRNSWWAIEKPNCLNCNKKVKYLWSSNKKRMKFCSVTCSKTGFFNGRFKGGIIERKGYRLIWIPKEERTQKSSYRLEHRVIMEKHLGRRIFPHELVHHINGFKKDNRIENLQLTNQKEHQSFHSSGKIGKIPIC